MRRSGLVRTVFAAVTLVLVVVVAAGTNSKVRDTLTSWLAPAPARAARADSKPMLREHYFNVQRAAPYTTIPAGALQRALAERDERVAAGTIASVDQVAAGRTIWTAIGPQPITAEKAAEAAGQPPYIGRITSIAVVDANVVYLGSATGGVWKTTNGGTDWAPLTDNAASLAIGAVAIDPNNSSIIYAGTGEQNFGGDNYYGFGVLKSTDAGATWTLASPTLFSRKTIGRIAVDPNDSRLIYAASSNGIAKSVDSGANWTTVCLTDCDVPVTDVVIDARAKPSTVYAAVGATAGNADNGVWKTTTGSDTWTKVGVGGVSPFPTTDVGRIRMAFASGSGTLFAITSGASDDRLLGVWKSTDAGVNWTQTSHPEESSGTTGSSVCKQCFYNLDIAVYPTDANVVYALAIELFRSLDGGATWSQISNGYVGPPYKLHVDQHAFAFVPGNSSAFFVGNDGGIYKTTDSGDNFSPLNQTLAITQFFRGALHPTSSTTVLGGSQDNGTLSYSGTLAWREVVGGDGGYAAIDFSTPTRVYATVQGLSIHRSLTGPTGTYASAQSGIAEATTEKRQFIAPLVMSPSSSLVLYAGTTRVYRTDNGADSWQSISPVLSLKNESDCAVMAIAEAPSASATVYAGTGSTSTCKATAWVTSNGGTNWTNVSSGLPDRAITSIAVDPTDANRAYLAVSGFDTGHIWLTTTGGQAWTNISGSLPNAPINAVVVNPRDPKLIYVGTDTGVYRSTDAGTTWAIYNSGIPNAVINDLVFNRAGTVLVAFTHGRSAYMTTVPLVNLPIMGRDFEQ